MTGQQPTGPAGELDDPSIAALDRVYRAMMAGDFAAVLVETEGVVDETPGPAQRYSWRHRTYQRVLALIHLGHEEEARRLGERFLDAATAMDDEESRGLALAASVWPAYMAGRDEIALHRLDEVLARAESPADPAGQARMMTIAAATAGSIGLAEVGDRLLTQVNAMIDLAPPGIVEAPLMRYLKTAQLVTRLYLAIACELDGSSRALDLHRSVGELCERALSGSWAPAGVPPESAALYRAARCLTRVALGLPADPDDAGLLERPLPAPGNARAESPESTESTESYDAIRATTETLAGLARLRSPAPGDGIDARLALADRLAGLARRGQQLSLEADARRLQLRLTEETGDPVAVAAARERFEDRLEELDWRSRVQRAHFAGFRSRTLGTLMEAPAR